jgi:hypothetical protein
MSSPANGSAFTNSCVTFTWGAGGVGQYHLQVGNSPGATNLYNNNVGGNRSQQVCNLPTNGSSVFTRLYTNLGSSWEYDDYSYTAAPAASGNKASMLAPATGSIITTSCASFVWSTGGLGQYHLQVGSTLGGTNYFNRNVGANLGQPVCTLPASGAIYVRLYTNLGNSWEYYDYLYTVRR